MNKIQVNHEVPICMLPNSHTFNDYEFILPHYLDMYSGYRDYMIKAKDDGRFIIMDNSLHELGSPYSEERLLYWVYKLKPNQFIVPDEWEDSSKTLYNARKWKDISLPEGTEKIAVVQFQKYQELVSLYLNLKDLGYKKIAFSYGASFYKNYYPHPNKELYGSLARVNTILTLLKEGVIKDEDRIHLLGCFVPQEFSWYKGIKQIESIDTSNPVMAGINDVTYKPFGLNKKPDVKIDDVINISPDILSLSLGNIMYNVEQFKLINSL